ncbi:uncharacterized protein [Amphiura filiformis]|uniref:uncharacterized protein n=1 Tax=Amphiura filiformis TaxID=82378 RepID=UPI003B21802A
MDVKLKTVIWVAGILYAVVLIKLLIHVDRYFTKIPYGLYADFESKRLQSFQVRIRNSGLTNKLPPIATTVVNMSRITDTITTTSTSIFGNNMTEEEQIIANDSLHFDLDNFLRKSEISNYYLSFQKGLNSETNIVIFVLSKWSHFRQRETIRKTWANELVANSTLNTQVALLFIIGKGDPEFQHHVIKEFQEHEDILIGEFPEDEHNGRSKSDVLKLLLGIDLIVGHHTSNPFVVIAFDDFYINLSLLHQNLQSVLLNTTLQDKFWIGNVRKGKIPIRDTTSPWFLAAKDYPASKLPTFCTMETGFVLTFGAAKDLHDRFIAQHYAILPLLDVFIGVAARDGNWSIWQDESVIPILIESGDICSMNHQTITTGFYSQQLLSTAHTARYNSTFYTSKQIQRHCFDPDLNGLLPSNVSNINLFKGVLSSATNPRNTCRIDDGRSNQEVFMIMLISSKPEHFNRRLVIRKTYGKETIIQNKHLRLLFVLGLSPTETINTKVQNEATIYKDMIIFDFQESHLNLTLKVIGGLKWVTEHCQKANFMYKGDDDMFVNIDVIVAHLKLLDSNIILNRNHYNVDSIHKRGDATQIGPNTYVNGTIITKVYINETFHIPKERLYMGCLNSGMVIRDKQSKFYVSEDDYAGKYFPPFLNGGSYVISGDIVPALFNASFSVPLINNDDVYQGILAKKIGIKPIQHDGFMNYHHGSTLGKIDVCQLRESIWTIHGFSGSTLNNLWENYIKGAQKCQ